ncbi:MAG TPA: S-methyl-5-thioribose-1-phosphate isomerase [Solirubrobacteraceae bacterium]|nr:S-methyl-5-thioribose-1-phosphate isomerase [Solirubrobacteraceae bacterium]
MSVTERDAAPLSWDGARLRILDQTLLPFEERVLELRGATDTAEAIRRLSVRGAPLIGVAAGYGLAMEVAERATPEALEEGSALLRDARPTAANLGRAVDRVRDAAQAAGPGRMAAAARAEAEAIHAEEDEASARMAAHGAELLAGARRVLTHCNTGALAAGGRGTALAVILELADRGTVDVLVNETRPLLQGGRLTVWELRRAGVEHVLLADGAAGGLIARGEVDAVVVGCDRVAANGDVANKVGTYGLALAAHAAGIPFVVAGPTSSIDPELDTGAGIPIEERDADEVRRAGGALLTVEGTPCRNPAFDVTPAELITALVTERGIVQPVDRAGVAAVLAP